MAPNPQNPSDGELIDRCLKGHAESWGALVLRYRGSVFGVVRNMGLSVSDAEDVMQDTFVTLLSKLETVRDRERLGLWLAVTARRRALDRVDRAWYRREVEMATDMNVEDAATPLVDQLIAIERRQSVRRAVESMQRRCRELLTALYYRSDEPTYQDLAEKLGIAEGSIGPTRLRCLEKLRRLLAAERSR